MNTKTNKKTKKTRTKKIKLKTPINSIINLSEKEKNILCKSNTLQFSNFESVSLINAEYNNKLLNFIIKDQEDNVINLQKNNYYKYINTDWINEIKETYMYDRGVSDYNTVQQQIIDGQITEIINDYIKDRSNEDKNKTNVLHFWNSAKNLNSDISIRAHAHNYITFIDELTNDTLRNNLWKLLAFLSKNLIIANQSLPLICECKPNVFNPILYSVYISPVIFQNNSVIYDDNLKYDPKIKEEYITRYYKYIEDLYVFFLGPNHGFSPIETRKCFQKLWLCFNNTYLTENYKVITNNESLKDYDFNYNEYLTEFGYINGNMPREIICSNPIYLKNVCKLLSNEWNTKEWKGFYYYIVFKSLAMFNNNSKKIQDSFVRTYNSGVRIYRPPNIRANSQCLMVFNKLFTNLYIDKYNNYDAIKFMTNLSNDLKKVFVNMVRTSNFLTQNAKKDAILVAEHLKIIIGRPLTIADDFNVVYTNNDIWQNFNNYFKYRHKFMLSLINKYILNLPDINWNAYPFEFSGSQIFNLKMSYSQLTNTVYVPLACLQPPLLDLNGQSLEYNLGNIGFLLVSYMMRSVNLEGSTYDYNGIYRRLWSKTDYDKYAVYSDDLLRQYLKFNVNKYNIKISTDLTNNIVSYINSFVVCEQYLKEYHKKQHLEYVLIKLKIKHLYTYIAYLLREKIWSYTHNDKLGGIPYMINELILNLMISRSNYFQGIYNIHKNDGMYYNNKKTIEFL
jgi:predicted metalloendopeptidase